MCEKPVASRASVIGISFVSSEMKAWIRDPVASVAMNESTPMPTTTMALTMPTTSAAPIASAMAGATGTPCAIAYVEMTAPSVATKPIDRSNVRVQSGMIRLSAIRPVAAFPFRICFAVSQVLNVDGIQIAKTTTISAKT
jgi:hypothetical protein